MPIQPTEKSCISCQRRRAKNSTNEIYCVRLVFFNLGSNVDTCVGEKCAYVLCFFAISLRNGRRINNDCWKKEWQQSCGPSKSSILLDAEVSLGWTQMDTQPPAYRYYKQYLYKKYFFLSSLCNGIEFVFTLFN